ncbi:MAG: NUDIX domain-containing protein [Nanoarchaeota archaeon]
MSDNLKVTSENNYRKSIFIVVYRKTEKGILYLLLKRKLHWIGWEFPKGGIEPEEEIEDAIKRELKEETGQISLKIQKHNFSGKYKYDKKVLGRKFIGQTFSLYSAEIENEKVILDRREHSEYLWLPYPEAYKKLTYENQKKSLEIIDDLLKKDKVSSIRLHSKIYK